MAGKFALVIGNSEYDDPGLSQLKAPEADVRALVELLKDPQVGSFDKIITLINRPFAEVYLEIADFFADRKPSDLVLFYFSGHGVLDEQGRLYLVLKNTQRNRLSGSAIQTLFLKDEMDKCRSKQQILILDCCHSGAFAEGAKGDLGGLAITNATFEGLGRFVLTATDKTQFAWEGDKVIGDVQTSLFTHFMLEGLKTGAADSDGNGLITLDELYDYIYPHVVEATPYQKPRKIVYDQQGEFVIFKNPHPREIAPVELPLELRQAIESPLSSVREVVIKELESLLYGSVPGLALSAHTALKNMLNDDSHRVASACVQVLSTYDARNVRVEKERIGRERLAAEAAEQEQRARESVEAERKAKAAKAEAEIKAREEAKRIERERLAAQAALQEQRTRDGAEAERKAKAHAEMQVREEAARVERERLAAAQDRAAAVQVPKTAPKKNGFLRGVLILFGLAGAFAVLSILFWVFAFFVALVQRAGSQPAAPIATLDIYSNLAPTQGTSNNSIPITGGCPAFDTSILRPSGLITSVTMALATTADEKAPLNPTTTFQPNDVIHAVIAIQNAPSGSLFRIVWYAADVGSVAPCNSEITATTLATEGSRNIDFTLTPAKSWAVGLYRADIYINGYLDQVVFYNVK